MKYENIKFTCRNMSLLWDIPIHLYRDHIIDVSYEPFVLDINFSEHHFSELKETTSNINLIITKNFLLYALIIVKNSPYHIIIGPVKATKITNEELYHIMNKHKISAQRFDHVKTYFDSIRIMTIHNLSLLTRTWNAQINDEIGNLPHMETIDRESELQKDIYGDISEYYESTTQDNYNTKFNFDFEDRLMYIVQNGLTEEFKKMSQNTEDYRSRQSFISSNALRQYKDQCISMTTLMSRAAMRGGLNLDIAYRLFDLYCQRIELANNINDLISIQSVMLIDYTKRVEDLKTKKTSDPLISKALSYINRHLTMKLTASMIAKKIGINPNYLSIRFKTAMGQSIPNYINTQKINEAKMLLKFTDKSLAEIAYYLDYSSQNYFQNIFKKVTGQTPWEYRNSSHKDVHKNS